MFCPNCGKLYYDGRTECPFCGRTASEGSGNSAGQPTLQRQNAPRRETVITRGGRPVPRRVNTASQGTQHGVNPDLRRSVNVRMQSAPLRTGQRPVRPSAGTRGTNGPIAHPPRRPEGRVINPQAGDKARRDHAKKRKKSNTRRVIVLWIAALIVIATLLCLYFNGAFGKTDKTAPGKEFIEELITGDAEKAFKMLPYDPAKVYRDSMKSELNGTFEGDFDSFYAKYKMMGVAASDFDSFVSAAYSKITSEFKVGFVTLASGKFKVETETIDVRSYGESEVAAYRNDLQRSFSRAGVNIAEYFDPTAIESVDDARYRITVTSPEGASQNGEYQLSLVTISGKIYVIPSNSRLFAPGAGVSGSWEFTEDGTDVTVTFNSNGTGDVSSGDKTIPMTYQLIGTDGVRIVCPAFGEGATVCTYFVSGSVLTLTFPDGVIELSKKP